MLWISGIDVVDGKLAVWIIGSSGMYAVGIISMGANEPIEQRTEVILSEKSRRYLILTNGVSVHMLPDSDANCIPWWLKNWHLHAALLTA